MRTVLLLAALGVVGCGGTTSADFPIACPDMVCDGTYEQSPIVQQPGDITTLSIVIAISGPSSSLTWSYRDTSTVGVHTSTSAGQASTYFLAAPDTLSDGNPIVPGSGSTYLRKR